MKTKYAPVPDNNGLHPGKLFNSHAKAESAPISERQLFPADFALKRFSGKTYVSANKSSIMYVSMFC